MDKQTNPMSAGSEDTKPKAFDAKGSVGKQFTSKSGPGNNAGNKRQRY